MTINLDKYPQPLAPSLYIIVVASGGVGNANVEFYQSRVVAYRKDEAIQSVMKQLASEQPDLYERGKINGGWRATHVECISADDLERMFTERTDQERMLDMELIRLQQNSLLRQIVDNRDIPLMHQAIREGRISNYERLYLHDMLTKGENVQI